MNRLAGIDGSPNLHGGAQDPSRRRTAVPVIDLNDNADSSTSWLFIGILQPVLVVNGDADRMVPSSNTLDLLAGTRGRRSGTPI
jgi:fermentation-respiration switch protein FrsA (DUF1100 family)